MWSWNLRRGSSAASSSVGGAIFLSLRDVFSISCLISSGSIADLRDLSQVAEDMTNDISSYVSPFAPHGWSKDAKAWPRVLAVPYGQESGVVDNSGYLTRKKEVRFRE